MRKPAIWFPTVRTGTGSDSYVESLVDGLREFGLSAEISWLPHRAEYLPYTVRKLVPPKWANIVHANSWLPCRFIPNGFPFVATFHHSVHDPQFNPYKSSLQRIYHAHVIRGLERKTLHRADAIVAVSEYSSEKAKECFSDLKIRVIPNGISGSAFQPHYRREPFSGGPLRLLFVGSGIRRKGVDLLAPIMKALGQRFHLTVVGASTLLTRDLPSNITVLGRLGTNLELAEQFERADVFLFPSRLEGFGLAVVEAMAHGLPVVTTSGSALTEVVQEGLTGFLCAQDDVSSFVRAIQRLGEDPSLISAMGKNARHVALSRFSLTRSVGEYVKIYKELLHGS